MKDPMKKVAGVGCGGVGWVMKSNHGGVGTVGHAIYIYGGVGQEMHIHGGSPTFGRPAPLEAMHFHFRSSYLV